MTLSFKKLINALFVWCFFSLVSLGQDAFSPDGLIVYPKDERGAAKGQLLQIIHDAKTSIEMAVYQIKEPDIANALVERSKQGIRVRLILEKNPYQHAFNKGAQDEQLAKMIEAGVIVHERPDSLKEKYPHGHMHARYMIVDGAKFILTTGNFDETTFDHCRDFAIVINSNEKTKEGFQLLKGIFEGDWDNRPVTVPEDQSSIILGPEGQREKIGQFLNTSTKKLQIYQQYCNDESMAEILIALKNKGVEIQLLMMAYPTNYDTDPNQATQDQLMNAGIDVRLVDVDAHLYIHARSIIVDDAVALIGTASLSPPSLDHNRELSLIIKGKAVEDLAQQFARDWSQSLSLKEGRQKSAAKKLDWNQKFSK